eukprot:5246432-Prymnesium_polylepis.1
MSPSVKTTYAWLSSARRITSHLSHIKCAQPGAFQLRKVPSSWKVPRAGSAKSATACCGWLTCKLANAC